MQAPVAVHRQWGLNALTCRAAKLRKPAGTSYRSRIFAQAFTTETATPTSSGGNGATAAVQPPNTSAGPSAPTSASPDTTLPVAPPPMIYERIVGLGAEKALLPAWKTLMLGLVAGCYISFAATLAMSCGGNVPGVASANPGLQKFIFGAFGFPFGLTMVLICGAELFTGNTAILSAAVYEGRATMKQLAKNWFWSYLGNLLGSLIMVAAINATGLLAGAASTPVINIATMKATLPFKQVFVRSILCNWLVCAAIWQATAAAHMSGKFIGVWLPISAFAALGFEHCVANMFIVPMGLVLGANITWKQVFMNNLIPVSIGNTIAGTMLMAGVYSLAFGSLGKRFAGNKA